MRIGLLGPVEVVPDSGIPVTNLGGVRRSVLALLALNSPEVVSRDRLIDEFWHDREVKDPVNALHLHLTKLRAVVGSRLVRHGSGYRLDLRPGELDVDDFLRLHEQGRELLARGRHREASDVLREAGRLWRGPALADVVDTPFAARERARLDESRLLVGEQAVEADLALGRHGDLVPELTRLAAEHPTRERPHGQLMVALYRCGRHAEALAVYDRVRRFLADSLGLDPSADLRGLHRAVLGHDGELAGPGRREPARAGVLVTSVNGASRVPTSGHRAPPGRSRERAAPRGHPAVPPRP